MTKILRMGFYSIIMLFCVSIVSCSSSTPTLRPLKAGDVVVAFGDSLTFGTGAKSDQSYPARLQYEIGVEVINAGVPGEETSGGVKRIEKVLEKYRPQLVILGLGGNDQIRRRSSASIKANLGTIIRSIKLTGADVLLLAPPMPKLSLTVDPIYSELSEEFNIPLDDKSLPDLLAQRDMKSDTIHLNAKGYQALAESIARLLQVTGAVCCLV